MLGLLRRGDLFETISTTNKCENESEFITVISLSGEYSGNEHFDSELDYNS